MKGETGERLYVDDKGGTVHMGEGIAVVEGKYHSTENQPMFLHKKKRFVEGNLEEIYKFIDTLFSDPLTNMAYKVRCRISYRQLY